MSDTKHTLGDSPGNCEFDISRHYDDRSGRRSTCGIDDEICWCADDVGLIQYWWFRCYME